MPLNNLHDLFEVKLHAVYASEKRILDMLEDAASEAKEPALRDAFKHHHEETQEQVKRLDTVFKSIGRTYRSVDASVVEGLVEEKRRFLAEDPTPEIMDVFNVAAAVKTEHVEIAAYEDLLTLAEQMGGSDIAEPLRQNLEEERATLEKMMRFAKEGTIAPKTSEAGGKTEKPERAERSEKTDAATAGKSNAAAKAAREQNTTRVA